MDTRGGLAKVRHVLVEVLLWVAAAAGLVAIVLVACAYFFNITLIMFRTGSMEPTIPAGSVAVVQEIPASEVEVGDILTVNREGQMPVTHRVTSIDSGLSSEERVITMQGDANEVEDPAPYTITEGRRALFSVPGAANVVNQMGNPYVMAGVTLAASALVMWAFWPRTPTRTAGSEPQRTSPAAPTPRRARRAARGAVGAFVILGCASALTGWNPPAAAASHDDLVRETIEGHSITLTSIYRPGERTNMSPGDETVWDVGIAVSAADARRARTGVSLEGDFAFELTILSCPVQWVDSPTRARGGPQSCPDDAEQLMDNVRFQPNGDVLWLSEFDAGEGLWLRVHSQLPDSPSLPEAAESVLRVHAAGPGGEHESVTMEPGDQPEEATPGASDESLRSPDWSTDDGAHSESLARTGVSILGLLLAAAAAIVLGRMLQRRRPEEAQRYEP